MNPTDVFTECAKAGVSLSLNPSGGIHAAGNREAINRLLPTIRQHKPELLKLLTKSAKAINVNALAETIATEFGTTQEFCLAMLDDGDRALIEAGDKPTTHAWRGFVRLAMKPPEPVRRIPDWEALLITGWTPAGNPMQVRAENAEHKEFIERTNPNPQGPREAMPFNDELTF